MGIRGLGPQSPLCLHLAVWPWVSHCPLWAPEGIGLRQGWRTQVSSGADEAQEKWRVKMPVQGASSAQPTTARWQASQEVLEFFSSKKS